MKKIKRPTDKTDSGPTELPKKGKTATQRMTRICRLAFCPAGLRTFCCAKAAACLSRNAAAPGLCCASCWTLILPAVCIISKTRLCVVVSNSISAFVIISSDCEQHQRQSFISMGFSTAKKGHGHRSKAHLAGVICTPRLPTKSRLST